MVFSGVLLIGFLLAMMMNWYSAQKKEKIEQISKKFQGLKGEYEHLHLKMESTLKWKYRIKWAEKVYYLLLLVFGFMVYKSPSLLSYLLSDHPILSILFFGCSIIGFSMSNWYLDKRARRNEALVKKLKEQMKDAKRMLISQMDPVMIETVKEIVKADMREEIERLRNSNDGCSQKCQLTN